MDIGWPSCGAGTGRTFPAWEALPRQAVLLDGRGRLKAAGRQPLAARKAEIIQTKEGVYRGDGQDRGAAGAVESARWLAGRTGRIAGGRRLAGGGVRSVRPRALLRLPAGQILPQRFCLPLLPGGPLLRLIPVVVHEAVPFSSPAPGPSSRPKVPQCQPGKPGKSSAGQAVTGRLRRGALACQCHPRMACSAPSTEPP
jgi:hypothetical protein